MHRPAKVDKVVLADPVVPKLTQAGMRFVSVHLDRVPDPWVREVDPADELAVLVEDGVFRNWSGQAMHAEQGRHPGLQDAAGIRSVAALVEQAAHHSSTGSTPFRHAH